MSLHESVAARLIGTPLQRPTEWLREMKVPAPRIHPQRARRDYGVQSDEVHTLLTDECGFRIHLLREWLRDGPAIDAAGFAASMIYPFQAFNHAVVPTESAGNRSRLAAIDDAASKHTDPRAKGAT